MRRQSKSSKKSPPACPPSHKQNYVYLSGFVLIPDDVLPLLQRCVALDYEYDTKTNKRMWKIHKSQTLTVEFWDHEKVNALRVAEKLEDA